MRRYLILAAAVVMQLCLGATYAWAVFVAPIREATQLGQGPVQAPFTVFYVVFPATAIVAGALMGRLGPRRSAVLGGMVFGAGWIVAGLGAHSFAWTIVGIGVMGGIGVGFAYLTPIATCILWFPRHRGLVTGIAVAGFGGGAALVARIASRLMEDAAAGPFETLGRLGLAFLVLVPCAGAMMTTPKTVPIEDRSRLRPEGLLSEPVFRVLYFAMFCGLAAGLLVNANLRELAPGVDARMGAAAVGRFALANALGRIAWGFASDRFSPRPVLALNLLVQALLLLAATWTVSTPTALMGFALAVGFNYGGVLVLYAAAAARVWGASRVGRVYGWMFSANIPAALAPVLAGFAFDRWNSFTPATLPVALLLLVATALVLRAGGRAGYGDLDAPARDA